MSPRLVNILAILIIAALLLMIVANGMTKPLGRDEQMYCTAGVLLAQGKAIYSDFSYPSQMPCHPLLYAALFKIFNTRYYLLVGRAVSILCDILVVVCIIGIYRRVFTPFETCRIWLGLAGVVLYLFNPLVDYANSYAWNHDVVTSCVILSFWLFISSNSADKPRPWQTAAIGALLTLATSMRITTALVQMLFFAFILTRSAPSLRQRLKNITPFLVATALTLLWPAWVVLHAWRPFLLNLIKIPALYGAWLHKIGMVHSKPELIYTCLTTPGYLALISIVIYVSLITGCRHRKLTISNARCLLLAALLVLTFFVIALIPPTIWRQYLAMPVPFLVVTLAYPLRYLRTAAPEGAPHKHFRLAVVLLAACVTVGVTTYPVLLYRTPILLAPEAWVPIRLHKTSEDISQLANPPKRVLTLAPLFATEGGCTIYPELSAGAIVYRIADSLTPPERALTHTVGPETLAALVERRPPSVVVLGVEMDLLEASLFDSTLQRNDQKWEKKVYDGGITAYFRR
ncbi:MAG TPA: hypothetical protein VMX13_02955 [Sedimentisphaerales bacterium]|nr:hypothetical protein [Sedimentisphaerales bacterium]